MHDVSLLQDLVTVLLVSVFIIVVFQRLKVPSIIGFLLAGMVVGPYGFNLVSGTEQIEILSEIGIIFLMFMIGIELSIKELVAMWRKVFIGGGLQVFGTILLVTAIGILMKQPLNSSIFFGFLFSLSSTAIVLQLLQARREIKTTYGKTSVGILIFQDIIVVPMILLTPILAGKADNIWLEIGVLFLKIIAVLVVVLLLARYVVPYIFQLIMKTKNEELFLVAVLGLCFSVALLTHYVGLSLALGAFFAGLIISESDYSHHAVANVLPFRELFVSFFFVSTGMLLNLQFFVSHLGWVVLLAFGAMLIKMVVLGATARVLKNTITSRLMLMFCLFQVGEFSLLLSGIGKGYGLLSDANYQYFLSVSILTMALTPFVLNYSEPMVQFILKKVIRKKEISGYQQGTSSNVSSEEELSGHLVIIGYGLNGENLCKAARRAQIPYVVIESDNQAFLRAKEHQEPVIFGDATRDVIIKHVNINQARAVAIAIGDAQATKDIVKIIRKYTQTAYVIVRTTQVSEIEENIKVGADFVIPEEYETGIQMFTRVLNRYMIPRDDIQAYVNKLRSSNYSLLTEDEQDNEGFAHMRVPEKGLYTLRVECGNNSVVGRSLFESQIRQRFGVTVLAIRRGNEYITDFSDDTQILQGDLLYLFATPDQICDISKKIVLKNELNV